MAARHSAAAQSHGHGTPVGVVGARLELVVLHHLEKFRLSNRLLLPFGRLLRDSIDLNRE